LDKAVEDNNEEQYLLGLTLAELKQVAKDLGMPAFTGGQMAKWLYEQHVKSIDEMTNISKANRAKLAAEYEIGCFGYSDAQHSVDGTIKYLFPTRSGKFVETVYIPYKAFPKPPPIVLLSYSYQNVL
jgi:23S rRNA (adenine2503-C2)-methyltransferase